MKIGVFGSASGELKDEVLHKARILGKEIAKKGHIIITGGCPGVPYEAVLGAKEVGGKSIGYSPAKDLQKHKAINYPIHGFDELKFTGLGRKGRNVLCVHDCDLAIFISGKIGTLNEFTIAYDDGIDLGILEGTGGFTSIAKLIIDTLNKPTTSKIIFDFDPIKLLDKLGG